MGAQGTTTVDFGAFPGDTDASTVVASAGIAAGSLVEAWLMPIPTADHTADEHIAEGPHIAILAGNIVAGVGFTIYAQIGDNPGTGMRDLKSGIVDKDGMLFYGLWTVGWVWNT